jgi:hypothetical protein
MMVLIMSYILGILRLKAPRNDTETNVILSAPSTTIRTGSRREESRCMEDAALHYEKRDPSLRSE